MTPIRAGCPRCGRIRLDSDDITLVVDPRQDEAWYVFDCIGCARLVVRSASDAVAAALISVDVTVSVVPAEVREEARLGREGRISMDDLLDAVLWLRTHDDVADRVPDMPPVPSRCPAPPTRSIRS